MKKISVIIPVYNVEEYLEECLNSVINQTIGLNNIEIIAINDGSSDNSINILKNYQKKYKGSFILIDRENKGLSISRNEGILKSSGKYIMFLDSDDYLKNDALEKMYNLAILEKSDIVVSRLNGFDSQGFYGYYSDKFIKKIKSFNINDNIKFVKTVSVCSKLYKASLIKNISFIAGVTHEDLYFTLFCYSKAKKITTLPEYCYFRRYREGEKKSIMQNLSIKTFNDQIINFDKYFLSKIANKKLIRFMILNLSNYIISRLSKKDKKIAIQNFNIFMQKLLNNLVINKIEYLYFMTFQKVYYNLANLCYNILGGRNAK